MANEAAGAAGTAAFPWMALLPIAQTLYGGFQSIRANQKLKKLRNENIEYKATPETKNILGVAAANARHGFTEAQKADIFQRFAAQTAKSYRMGMARAGNSLSNAIGASNDIANSNNFNNFAAQDANQQRQNQQVYNGLVGQEQQMANQNTAMAAHNNQMAQQAYGMAGQHGMDNIFTGIQMGSMLLGKNGNSDGTATDVVAPTIGTPTNYQGVSRDNMGNVYGKVAPYNSFWNQFYKPQ